MGAGGGLDPALDAYLGKLASGLVRALGPVRRGDLAAAAIPALSLVEQMAVHRAPLPVFAPRSRVTRSYQDLWAEVRDRGAEPRR